jgi:hypothetical protein
MRIIIFLTFVILFVGWEMSSKRFLMDVETLEVSKKLETNTIILRLVMYLIWKIII